MRRDPLPDDAAAVVQLGPRLPRRVPLSGGFSLQAFATASCTSRSDHPEPCRSRGRRPTPSMVPAVHTIHSPPPCCLGRARMLQFSAETTGGLVMPKLDFQGSEHSGFYRPELGIALQDELRALADIECTYEEQRDGLERSALPPSIKEHLANQLEERRASSREPHEQTAGAAPR
jgi:hypothetical protein